MMISATNPNWQTLASKESWSFVSVFTFMETKWWNTIPHTVRRTELPFQNVYHSPKCHSHSSQTNIQWFMAFHIKFKIVHSIKRDKVYISSCDYDQIQSQKSSIQNPANQTKDMQYWFRSRANIFNKYHNHTFVEWEVIMCKILVIGIKCIPIFRLGVYQWQTSKL